MTQFFEGPTLNSWKKYEEVPEFINVKVHKMFKSACIILLFLLRAKNVSEVTLGMSPTIYGKKIIV